MEPRELKGIKRKGIWILCAAALVAALAIAGSCGVYAWFQTSVVNAGNSIGAGTFDLDIDVTSQATEGQGEGQSFQALAPDPSSPTRTYSLSIGSYTVELKPKEGSTVPGYCKITSGDNTWYTDSIQPGEETAPLSFTLHVSQNDATYTFTPSWGIYAGDTENLIGTGGTIGEPLENNQAEEPLSLAPLPEANGLPESSLGTPGMKPETAPTVPEETDPEGTTGPAETTDPEEEQESNQLPESSEPSLVPEESGTATSETSQPDTEPSSVPGQEPVADSSQPSSQVEAGETPGTSIQPGTSDTPVGEVVQGSISEAAPDMQGQTAETTHSAPESLEGLVQEAEE